MSAQPEPVFFTDRNLGKQFSQLLKSAGIQVERHIDHFPDDAKDEDWLSEIGVRGWYAVTHDKNIRYKPNEIAAVKQFGVGLFIMIGKAPFREHAQNFVNTISRIEKFIRKHPRPFIAKIYRADLNRRQKNPDAAGAVEMWVSSQDF